MVKIVADVKRGTHMSAIWGTVPVSFPINSITLPVKSREDGIDFYNLTYGAQKGFLPGARFQFDSLSLTCDFLESIYDLIPGSEDGDYNTTDASDMVIAVALEDGTDFVFTVASLVIGNIDPGELSDGDKIEMTVDFQRFDPDGSKGVVMTPPA